MNFHLLNILPLEFLKTLLFDAVLIRFLGINVMKGQQDFGSINCLSTVNERINLYLNSNIDANVWKTTGVAVNRSYPGPENSNISG